MIDKYRVLLVIFLSVFGMTATNLIYTNIAQHRTEQKFCSIINNVVDAYKAGPEPKTELGMRIRENYYQLQKDLRC